jgi:hypothetical protein
MQYGINVWMERDRKHVHLFRGDENDTIIEWWDEEVDEMVEDGFLNPRDWEGSAIEYAKDMGLIKN